MKINYHYRKSVKKIGIAFESCGYQVGLLANRYCKVCRISGVNTMKECINLRSRAFSHIYLVTGRGLQRLLLSLSFRSGSYEQYDGQQQHGYDKCDPYEPPFKGMVLQSTKGLYYRCQQATPKQRAKKQADNVTP